MSILRLRKGPGPNALPLAMSGLRLGERLLWIGSGEASMFAALAAKVGLTGRACAVAENESDARALSAAGARQGTLVEVEVAPLHALPFADESFDIAVVAGRSALDTTPAGDRQAAFGDVLRTLRPGGRLLNIQRTATGLAALFGGGSGERESSTEQSLTAVGFRPVRRLARQQGFVFVEGLKPRT